eukprot:6564761-Pyramimonas_sp.AAC.1
MGLVDMIRERTFDTQQGFVKGRNIGQHVLTLDSEARRAGHSPVAQDALPILVSFNIKAAFPSLGWGFVFASLMAHGVPPGYRGAIYALCRGPGAWARVGGQLQYMFEIGSGVLQ